MPVFSGRGRVDSAVDSGPFGGDFFDLFTFFEHGRQVDINLSKLLGYIYILDNKGKVDRRSFRAAVCENLNTTLRNVWEFPLPVYSCRFLNVFRGASA